MQKPSTADDKNGNKIPNAHVVATTFDLTYTGGFALNSGNASINGNASYVTALYAAAYDYAFPQNVLDAYDPAKPGDCTGPLGAACVHALTAQSLSVGSSTLGFNLSVPACADVLGGLDDILYDDLSAASGVSELLAFSSARSSET